jgi:hypothetical protein
VTLREKWIHEIREAAIQDPFNQFFALGAHSYVARPFVSAAELRFSRAQFDRFSHEPVLAAVFEPSRTIGR